MPKTFYITTPIYYVNDKPHIGHSYSTIAADVLARFRRLHGDDVFFLTGTDEHGAKVAQSAADAGMEPKAFTDANSAKYRDVFAKLNIRYDHFIRTTDEAHERQVKVFLQKLQDAGAIYESEYKGLYCTGCEEFLTEKELVDGKCPRHNKVPEVITEKNYFFKLTDYLQKVKELIENGTIRIEPDSRRQETLGLFKQDLQDFSISREKVAWGIPFPFNPKQTVYVWVEALQNYITAIGYGDDRPRFEKYWPHVFHIIGKDILKFHAVYWPALLLAAGEVPPKRLFIHGFFTVNGQKMSKSLGNAIDPLALIDRFGVDGTRYLLLTQFPFGDDGDVQQERFTEKYNADLANTLGNLVSRTLTMVEKFSGGEVPTFDAALLEKKDRLPLLAEAEEAWQKVTDALDAAAPEKALRPIWQLLSSANIYIDKSKPWDLVKSDPDRLKVVLVDLLLALQQVAWLLAAFLPATAQTLADALGLGALDDAAKRTEYLKPGRSLPRVQPLFPRLDKEAL